MDESGSSTHLVYLIRILGFANLLFSIYATVNIFQSIRFRFWVSRDMDDMTKREFYVQNRFDLKWPFCLIVVCVLGSVVFNLNGRSGLAFLELVCAFLFWLLLWGNYRTLNLEIERLNRKKDLGL